jgi:hypothetical protein
MDLLLAVVAGAQLDDPTLCRTLRKNHLHAIDARRKMEFD